VGGFLIGLLALAALARVVRSDPASSRVAGLFAVPAELASRFLDPNVPAIGAAHDAATGTTTPRKPLDSTSTTPNPKGAQPIGPGGVYAPYGADRAAYPDPWSMPAALAPSN
jgi:hypothetical protein